MSTQSRVLSIYTEGVRLYGNVELGSGVILDDPVSIGYDSDIDSRNTVIGDDVRIGAFSLLYSGCRISKGCILEPYSSVGHGSALSENVRLLYRAQVFREVDVGPESVIGGFLCDRTVIGRRCRVFGTTVHSAKPPWGEWDTVEESAPHLSDDVFVGMNATLIGDIEIGTRAFIAAGAVVTTSVPPNTLVVGCNEFRSLPISWLK